MGKKFTAMVFALTMMLAMCVTASASFTFTNVKESQPDLYVTKTVSSALEGYTVPEDAVFTFVLRWDRNGDGELEFADNEVYYIYDRMGNQIMNEETSSYIFRTSAYGQFTLKADQTARFEWAGEVEYEITELESEDFIQTYPAGQEAASGTVDADGTVVTFENLYIPVTASEDTVIAVRKDITWPDGYEVPSVDAEFEFVIRLDGKAYANEPYRIFNADMTEELGRGTTGSEGHFTVSAGETALFEEVETGIDYEISEVGTDGWRAVGTTETAGSTVSPIVYAYFTNAPYTLTVSKVRSDAVTGLDDEFTFVITDENDEPLAGQRYYVYDEDGKLVRETALVTDEDGHFTLKAGETALFYGVSGPYAVAEEDIYGFDGSYETDGDAWVFTNSPLTDITVKKTERDNGSRLLGGAEFTIYRLIDGADPDDPDGWEEYIPAGQETSSVITDDDPESDSYGSAVFKGISAGTYKIAETAAPEGYKISGSPIIVTVPYTLTEEDVIEGHIDTGSDDFNGLYSERDNVWYIYDLTYTVLDTRNMIEMPTTGSYPWLPIAVCFGSAAVIAGAAVIRKRRAA